MQTQNPKDKLHSCLTKLNSYSYKTYSYYLGYEPAYSSTIPGCSRPEVFSLVKQRHSFTKKAGMNCEKKLIFQTNSLETMRSFIEALTEDKVY